MRFFMLSPAYCGGRRAQLLLRPGARSDLAIKLHDGTLTLGEAFTFMSGLYFRGKLTYARTFAAAAGTAERTFVITPTRGLQAPDAIVTPAVLHEFASVDVAADEPRYRAPLERDLSRLASTLPEAAQVVLLGSIATGKYLDVLTAQLGERLYFPPSFIGRGDMSRGGLLLRQARAGEELPYVRFDAGLTRRGPRPPRLR